MKIGRAAIFGVMLIILLAFLGASVKPQKDIFIPASENIIENEADKEMRAVWVSSAYCLDFPTKPDMPEKEQRAQIDEIVDKISQLGLNTIFFQVHPASDSLYKSDVFPVSAYLTVSGNIGSFDPFEYIIEKAHENDIELHAWINPFRVSDSSYSEFDDEYKGYCIEYDGKLYFDPGQPRVRERIVNCVCEIIENYHPDGIHFDDYFYPYPVDGVEFNDTASFSEYGQGMEIDDFRRHNIDELIRLTSKRCRDNNTVFGVSPFGVWANSETKPEGSDTGNSLQSYTDIYADSLGWAKKGYVDYLCPQIYWSMTQSGVEFPKVCDWWRDSLKDTDAKLYIGIALYKGIDDEYGWDEDEIKNQIDYLRNAGCDGFALFRYGSLVNAKDCISKSFSCNIA